MITSEEARKYYPERDVPRHPERMVIALLTLIHELKTGYARDILKQLAVSDEAIEVLEWLFQRFQGHPQPFPRLIEMLDETPDVPMSGYWVLTEAGLAAAGLPREPHVATFLDDLASI